MKYKRTNMIILLIFTLIVACPLVLTNTDPDAISWEDNKALADDPLTVAMSGEDTFSNAVDNYIDDRIGLRRNAIKTNSRIDYFAFHKSSTDFVVFGEDGWLFSDDGTTVNQAMGFLTYSPETLEQIADNMMQVKEYLAERNCEFILYIAPNKERVYFDKLPGYYSEYQLSETCNTEQIIDYLRENTDIKVVWPYEDIKEYKENNPEQDLYYKLDTHWNKVGGYIGAKALLNELQIEIPDLEEQTITESVYEDSGDLYDRLGLYPAAHMEDALYRIDGYTYNADDYLYLDFYGNWLFTNKGKDARKLMIVRDSFCTAMADYIANEFDQVNMIHQNSFEQSVVDEIQPDVFVLEIVEKNDYYLGRFTMTD